MTHILRCLLMLGLVLGGIAFNLKAYADPKLNGISTYTELGAEQFIAGLYCEKLSSDPRNVLLDEGEKRMEVRVIAGFLLSNRFKRMWIEGVAINASPEELQKHSQHLADFSNMLAIKLQRDDTLSIIKQEKNVVVQLNNIELGRIPDPHFFDILLRTWIGPVPLSSGFRDGLMTAGKINDKELSIYTKVVATPERISAIKTALIASGKNKNKNKLDKDLAPTEKPQIAKTPDAAPAVTKDAANKEKAAKEKEAAIAAAAKSSAEANKNAANTVIEPVKTETAKVETAKTEASKAEPKETKETKVATLTPAVTAPATLVPAATEAATSSKAPSAIFEEEDKQETADSLLVQQLYISKLSKRTAGFVKYPPSALEKNQTGSVRLVITINKNGAVTNVKTSTASEFEVLNQAAIEAANKAAPYPPIPDEIKSDSFVFTVPVAFRIKSK